jgi:hypothetical protein
MRSRLLVCVLALALTGAIASCDNDITAISEGFDQTATWRANMDAAQETPAPNLAGSTNPSGRAWVTDNGNTMTWYMEYNGLTGNAVAAHIHRGAPGVGGPIVANLFVSAVPGTSATVAGHIDMTVADLAPGTTETVSPDSVRTLLNNGNAYINVHTGQNGAGEIRGQVQRN